MARHALRDSKSRRAVAARHYALRSVRPSPARAQAPVPEAWLPLADLHKLPDLDVIIVPADVVAAAAPEARAVTTAPAPVIEPEERTSAVERVEPALVGFVELPELPTWAGAAPAVRASDRRGRRAAERRARTKRRRTRLTIIAGLVLIVGAILWKLLLPTHHEVDINVDGQRIRTGSADTVGDALANAEIWVGPFDRVQPSLDASIPARGLIEVQRAHPVMLDIDGKQQAVWTTATTLAALRAELKVDPALVAIGAASTPNLDPTAPVVFRSSRPVTVVADGGTQPMATTALTTGELLSDNGIVLGAQDQVSPAADQPVPVGGTVTVVRVAAGQRSEPRVIAYSTQQKLDPTLAKGQYRVLQDGVNGSETVTYQQTIRDGQVVAETPIGTTVTLAAKPKIVAVGTRASVVAAAPATTRAPSIAAVSGTGHTESGQATYYATAPGTCAHKTIAMGTVVTVTNTANGRSTTCVVADRGPYAAGRIIDLSPDTFDKIASRSQGVASVTLTW